jgi:hypothetical protein
MSIELLLGQWPYVFSKFEGDMTIADLDAYFQRFKVVHARREPYVGISFVKQVTRDRALLNRMARWMKEAEQGTRELCMATALISPSLGFRFVLGTLFLIKPMACPYQVHLKFESAIAFVRAEAQKRGVVLPEAHRPWPDLP